VEGTSPFHYEWRKDLRPVPGGTDATLGFAEVSLKDAGSYSVAVSSPYGTATSEPATLTVLTPPRITTQPSDLALLAGQPARLEVAAEGTAPLAYQWLFDGQAVPDATHALHLIPAVRPVDAGAYQVVVSNSAGAVTSVVARLRVLLPPQFTTQLDDQTVVTGSDVSFTAVATGREPLSYQWFKDGSPIADGIGSVLELVAVRTGDAGRYSVAVVNPDGTAEMAATLTVVVPPRIIRQPQSVSVVAGQSVGFSVEAEGTGPLSYQWRHGEAEVPAGTGPALLIETARRASSGVYAVTITTAHGGATSSNAVLRVLVPQRLELPERLATGGFRLRFRDHDGALAEDLAAFVLQWSDVVPATSPAAWQDSAAVPSVQGGFGVFEDPAPVGPGHRFYRVIER
jgi:hypothetical protein